MAGELVRFPSNGDTCQGYLTVPAGRGPGVIVIQEWWGLVGHIESVADRLGYEGFVALAPDLYHGQETTEPDEARKLAMGLQLDAVARDLAGAVDFLLAHDRVQPKTVGSVGFCMGGALSLVLGTIRPTSAIVSYYGVPSSEPDWSTLRGPVLAHFGERDHGLAPEKVDAFTQTLRAAGVSVEVHVYPGTDHGFFNDDRAEAYAPEAARLSWDRTLAFFREHLGP